MYPKQEVTSIIFSILLTNYKLSFFNGPVKYAWLCKLKQLYCRQRLTSNC